MNVSIKLVIAVATALIAGLSFAANPAKGIYSNDEEGKNQCLTDLSAGKGVGYKPSLKNPITSKEFEMKKVGPTGACLLKARVTGDDGHGTQVAVALVTEGFAYGQLVKDGKIVDLRMAACSNHFEGLVFPVAKVVKQPEPTPEPKPVPPPVKVAEPAPVPVVVQPAPAVVAPVATCADCTPPRPTAINGTEQCRIKAGTDRVPECTFQWSLLRTQDQLQNCGCQILVPQPRQIIGFPTAHPGSPLCELQKKLWANVQGLAYTSARAPQ